MHLYYTLTAIAVLKRIRGKNKDVTIVFVEKEKYPRNLV